jgi:DNA-binding Lrp family transcriptional regulator
MEENMDTKNTVTREVLGCLARFGYLSVEEVAYGCRTSRASAQRRLRRLEDAGLIRSFPSQTVPVEFQCLTTQGRQKVVELGLSDELSPFMPCRYQWVEQHHHRTIVKVYLALRHLLGPDFLGWVSERALKGEAEAAGKLSAWEKRVLDGELYLNVNIDEIEKDPSGLLKSTGQVFKESWRCGIEVELSIKSSDRYRKQFMALADIVQEGKSPLSMIVFFHATPGIRERLLRQVAQVVRADFGACVFCFVSVGEFLCDPVSCRLERIFHGQHSVTEGSRINRFQRVRGFSHV